MRALKLLTDFVKWRWTPCVALVVSSLLYVLIAVLLVPDNLSLPSSERSVNIVNAVDQPNALGAPRNSPPGPGFNQPRSVSRPVMAAPPPAPAPAAPPPPPVPEDRPPEPPPPPPPPPPAPEPAPTPEQAAEEGAEETRAPAPKGSRFSSARLRVLPALAAQVNAAAPAAAAPDSPADSEEE